MKNLILGIAMMVFFGWSNRADAQDINYGIMIGGGISQLHLNVLNDLPVFSNNPIASYQVNGYIQYKPSDYWGLRIEPGYIRKGGEICVLPSLTTVKTDLKMDYIHMPMLFQFYPRDYISAEIGPELSYLINSNVDYLSLIMDPIKNKFNLGLNAGLTYHTEGPLSIGLRYNKVFTPIQKIPLEGFAGIFKKDINLTQQNFSLVVSLQL